MEYQADVEKEAFDFLSDIEDDIKEAIVNGEDDIWNIQCDTSGYGDIRDFFHESVIDRSYSVEDAAFIIANCENDETDSGLWEGQEMFNALQICAAFSYGNDVWEKVEEAYNEMLEAFEPSYIVVDATGEKYGEFPEENDAMGFITNHNEPEDAAGMEVEEGRGNIDELWQEYEDDHTVSEIETDGNEELQVLKQWVRLAENAGTWGGYPFGSVYIDSRCGAGYSMPDVKNFDDYDRIARRKVPSMTGKYIAAVKVRIDELEGITGKQYTMTVSIEDDSINEILAHLDEIKDRIIGGHENGFGWGLRNRRKG